MTIDKKRVFLYILAIGLFLILGIPIASDEGIDMSVRQFAAFPIVLVMVFGITLWKRRIPGALILAAFSVGLFGFTVSRINNATQVYPYLVSRLQGDDYGAESRVFRSIINSSHPLGASIYGEPYHSSLETHTGARKLFKEDKDLQAVVWGSNRWVSISFPFEQAKTLGELGAKETYSSLLDYKLVMSVPVIGMSYKPADGTANYIANLMDAMSSSDWGERLGWPEGSNAVMKLRNTGSVTSLWTSYSHRAYPWWLVGNAHLLEAIRSDVYYPGKIKCAIDSYERAAHFIRKRDNPELVAAIANNMALAYLARFSIEAKSGQKKLVREKLKDAMAMSQLNNPAGVRYRAPKVAAHNLKKLREEQSGRRAVRQAKKKRSRKKNA